MTARIGGSGGYVSPLSTSLARLPGDFDGAMNGIRREAVANDPLSGIAMSGEGQLDSGNISPIVIAPLTVEDYVGAFLPSCRYPPIDTNYPVASLKGLQVLAKSGCWKEVVEMSDRLINQTPDYKSYRSPGADELSLPWRYRLEGLFRLKMFDELSLEVGIILQQEEELFEHRTDGNPIESCVALTMRILFSEIKLMTGRIDEAIETLFTLKSWLQSVRRIDTGSAHSHSLTERMLLQVQCSIVNVYVRQRHWRMVVAELHQIFQQISTSMTVHKSKHGSVPCALEECRVVVMCLLSRTLLQVGAMKPSMLYCEQAWAAFSDLDKSSDSVSHSTLWEQVQITRGLVFFTRDKFEEAKIVFQSVIDRSKERIAAEDAAQDDAASFFASSSAALSPFSPLNITNDGKDESTGIGTGTAAAALFGIVEGGADNNTNSCLECSDAEKLGFVLLKHPLVHADLQHSLLAVAVNNYSICCLFLKQVTRAISVLESLIMEDPVRHLCDPVVFNLCTLYDLSCAPELSSMKKKVLQRVATLYHINDSMLNWQSFRLN